LAFGKKKPGSSSLIQTISASSNTPSSSNDAQFANWVSKDQEFVNETYASELHAAILASKVDFRVEQKRRQSESSNPDDKNKIKTNKDGKKITTMSLDAFNNLSVDGKSPKKQRTISKSTVDYPDNGDNFFDELEEATKKALIREEVKESLKQRSVCSIFSF
jgi:hypothetical protein